uniref:GFA family protein n=1 Tax=Cohaesibacter marisflavi TaxID=655353 RepID=UPI001FCDFB2A|nr:GFA family protein [Cohaesibacter marisflavi]
MKFRISGDPERFFLYHCSRCREDSASTYSANLFSSSSSITWLLGEENVKVFKLPRTRHTKCFCTICGSALPFYQSNGDILVVPVGSLDSPVSLRPNAHICFSMRANWDNDVNRRAKLTHLGGL